MSGVNVESRYFGNFNITFSCTSLASRVMDYPNIHHHTRVTYSFLVDTMSTNKDISLHLCGRLMFYVLNEMYTQKRFGNELLVEAESLLTQVNNLWTKVLQNRSFKEETQHKHQPSGYVIYGLPDLPCKVGIRIQEFITYDAGDPDEAKKFMALAHALQSPLAPLPELFHVFLQVLHEACRRPSASSHFTLTPTETLLCQAPKRSQVLQDIDQKLTALPFALQLVFPLPLIQMTQDVLRKTIDVAQKNKTDQQKTLFFIS